MAETMRLAFASHSEFPYAGGTKKGFKFLTPEGKEYVAFDPDLYAAFVKAGNPGESRNYLCRPCMDVLLAEPDRMNQEALFA